MPAKRQGIVAGLERTLRAMKKDGDLDIVDDAVVELAKGLAAAVEADPANAALWREYRAALSALREAGQDGEAIDDSAARFWLEVRTPLGNSKNT